MSDRLIQDLRSMDHIEAVRRLKKYLEEGGGDYPIGLRLSDDLAVVGTASVLERRGWRVRKYRAGDDHLVLGSPPGYPPITVWYGRGGWKLRRGDDESRDNAPEPQARLMSETGPAGGAAAANRDDGKNAADLSRLTAVIINGDSMGYGNSEVGQRLLLTYFDILTAMAAPPDVIFFYNSASRLTAQPSALFPAIRDLALQGTQVLTSSLCLERLNLGDKLMVGRKSNMYELVNIISTYGNVIYL